MIIFWIQLFDIFNVSPDFILSTVVCQSNGIISVPWRKRLFCGLLSTQFGQLHIDSLFTEILSYFMKQGINVYTYYFHL